MLITKQEIIDIAYISTTITVADILDSAISTAELTYAQEAMSDSLYEDVSTNPSDPVYNTLLTDYIKPFLALIIHLTRNHNDAVIVGFDIVWDQQRGNNIFRFLAGKMTAVETSDGHFVPPFSIYRFRKNKCFQFVLTTFFITNRCLFLPVKKSLQVFPLRL